MGESRSSISKARSYQEMGEYWDQHDLGDVWDQTKPVEVEVDLRSDRTYYAVEQSLARKISEMADRSGVSAETLLNLWIQEKLATSH